MNAMERGVESTAAKMVGRYLTPVLLSVLSIIGGRILLNQDEANRHLATMDTAIAVLTTRVDERVIRQVDANVSHLAVHDNEIMDLQARVSRVENHK